MRCRFSLLFLDIFVKKFCATNIISCAIFIAWAVISKILSKCAGPLPNYAAPELRRFLACIAAHFGSGYCNKIEISWCGRRTRRVVTSCCRHRRDSNFSTPQETSCKRPCTKLPFQSSLPVRVRKRRLDSFVNRHMIWFKSWPELDLRYFRHLNSDNTTWFLSETP